MAVFNLTAAQPLMKIYFNPRISKQFNSAAVLFNRFFDGKGIPISNRGMEIPTHMQPNASMAWFSDGGNLPVGGSESLSSALIGFFSFAVAVQLTGAALDAAGNDAVTYARALSFNVKMATINAINYLGIYSFLDGTGTLAKIGANVSLVTNATNTVNLTGTIENGHYLFPGATYDVIHSGTVQTTMVLNSLPNAINDASSATNAVFAAASTAYSAVSGDQIVLSGSLNNVMNGLEVIVDNGTVATTFQNINRSTNPQYNAGVIALSGSPALTQDHLRELVAKIQILQGRVSPSLEFWSHPSQLHAYMSAGWQMKRFNDANKTLDLGYTSVEWESFPWIVDTKCPKDRIFALDRDLMFKVTARELSFDDRTGSILRQVPSSTAGQYTDAFVSFLLFRGNLGTYIPNAHAQLNGLAVPATY